MLSSEIFRSLRIQDDRWASLELVIQSEPACAKPRLEQARAVTVRINERFRFTIKQSP